MSLFGFDAMQNWEGLPAELRFWCYIVVFAPLLLCIAANFLLHHLAWPRTRGIR